MWRVGKKLWFIILISVTLVLFGFYERQIYSDFAAYLTQPILKLHFELDKICQKLYRTGSESQLLCQEIAQLRSENIALMAQLNHLDGCRELTEFAKRYSIEDRLLAQIFFKDLRVDMQYMLVDKGRRNGVQPDMVAVWQNLLVGKVVEVNQFYSKIALLTSALCKVAVYGAQNQAIGICIGHGSPTELELKYVSHLQRLKLNEKLISSGEGKTFPAGFGVASVTEAKINGVYYEAVAKPLIDCRAINHCYLIAGNQVGLQT